MPPFTRLVRFIPVFSPEVILIGEPVQHDLDVGSALYHGEPVYVHVFSGASVLDCGRKTGATEQVLRLLSPMSRAEIGSIRCIGLNYVSHAQEMSLPLPQVPTVFLKPSTALCDPWPASSILPKITQRDHTGDYESELAVVIGRDAKNVSPEHAMDYVLGYTAANDVSSRTSQNNQSQWCFSKGFDTSCPLGPALVSKDLVPDIGKLHISGMKNGQLMQDCDISDLIFDVAELVSFLSQGTTLPAGTVILTGTPPGVGAGQEPKAFLKHGDEFAVEIKPYIGTLITKFEDEA
ncbi:hypothetical protein ASPFODRAFT_49678 [Aspergillus luchuensis CBS 106.47]|uniref:Fumarylacetoacetase-like C-terminal domain-containing protein n=1 Tax=Aspergillus luchuensis (strain CBS 106.47) TaxID=1137211 RepID=A0A1M3T8E6_ASPLC|nr:hypothetical protein ASPFODRAFT_49678 [Aspergillus luchuensis CBS 106.47]